MVRHRMFPADPFTVLRGAVSRAFDQLPSWQEAPWFQATSSFPALNAWQDKDNVYVEAELPGVKANDIEAMAVGQELTIRGRRTVLENSNLVYHRQERGTGEFVRVLTLPIEVDAEQVQASLKDGVLTLTLPKAKAAKARKIEVKAG